MRITKRAQEKPFALTDFLLYPIFIGIILISIRGIVGCVLMRKKNAPLVVSSITENRHSIDDAFDDPDYDPFSNEKGKQKISKKRIKHEKENPSNKNNDDVDEDLKINHTEDTKVLEEMAELRAKLKELEDKNLSVNEVMSASDIEELIGEEE